MTVDRGFTYTEQHRHECEVRHVMALPTRQARADYIASITKRRGEAAGERMRADLSTAWASRRQATNPPPPSGKGGRDLDAAAGAAVNPAVNPDVPDVGSFLASAHEGSLRPAGCVVSGAAA